MGWGFCLFGWLPFFLLFPSFASFSENICIEKEQNVVWMMLFLCRVGCSWEYRIHRATCLLNVCRIVTPNFLTEQLSQSPWPGPWCESSWVFLYIYPLQSMRKSDSAILDTALCLYTASSHKATESKLDSRGQDCSLTPCFSIVLHMYIF